MTREARHEAGASEGGRGRFDVLTPLASEDRREPFWLFLGRALTTRATTEGPNRIRVKLDVLPHHGGVLHFGPGEGEFDLVLEPEDFDDTVPIRVPIVRRL